MYIVKLNSKFNLNVFFYIFKYHYSFPKRKTFIFNFSIDMYRTHSKWCQFSGVFPFFLQQCMQTIQVQKNILRNLHHKCYLVHLTESDFYSNCFWVLKCSRCVLNRILCQDSITSDWIKMIGNLLNDSKCRWWVGK